MRNHKKRRAMKKKRQRASTVGARDEEAAREKCLRLLGLRARSAAELRLRPRTEGFPDPVVESVLSDLASAKLVDDEEFARAWVASRQASAAAGRQKLRWELRRKGISKELIQQVVEDGIDDEAELEHAVALARRRPGDERPDAKARTRLRRWLLGRGFEFGTVDTVLRRISEGDEHS